MARGHLIPIAGLLALATAGGVGASSADICIDCVSVRVGPALVVRGPFPDEIDAPFTALRLEDGSFRGFSANGSTYAIDGADLWDMSGPRREVLQAGAPGSLNDCGSWLTSMARTGDTVLGFVHQEADCDYNEGRTHKSMAIATSTDDGLHWTDLGTVITGQDQPTAGTITGEGDCTLVDGHDGYLYGYCLRNSDWQTIVARAPAEAPTEWHKYFEGTWTEPGLGGRASDIGFIGTGAGYLEPQGWVVAVSTDPWAGGIRLSLSADKVSFLDLDDPIVPIDEANWERPAATDLSVYATVLNPETGSNTVSGDFVLSYLYVPPGLGFESRYLVVHEVSLTVAEGPVDGPQAGIALTRWVDEGRKSVTTTGPLTGERKGFRLDGVIAHLLTRAPEGAESVKLAECSSGARHRLAVDGTCEADGFMRQRVAGWVYASEQAGTVPIYRCRGQAGAEFISRAADCEGLGTVDALLGYGLSR